MRVRAQATFTIKTWDEQPVDEASGSKLTRTHVVKAFQGDVEGDSTAELLMAYAREGSAAYVGFERFVGRVHDRTGSFILRHNATSARGRQAAEWTIVPDSGAEQLRGISGEAHIARDAGGGHTFALEYELD